MKTLSAVVFEDSNIEASRDIADEERRFLEEDGWKLVKTIHDIEADTIEYHYEIEEEYDYVADMMRECDTYIWE